MAAVSALVGEVVVSSVFKAIFGKLASIDVLKFARSKHVESEMKKWKKSLLILDAVLEDAEEKQITNRAVKIWLSDLRDLAFDVEDVLDEFATKALQQKLTAGDQATPGKVRKLIHTLCAPLNYLAAVKIRVKLGSKIGEISARLQNIIEEKGALELKDSVRMRSSSSSTVCNSTPSTSLVGATKVYGREKDKEALIDLLGSEGNNNQLSVIAIVGMGGIGKTTLAQLVYNDHTVKTSFDKQVWVCVSEKFDIVRITQTILQAITLEIPYHNDLDRLQRSLTEVLRGKKILLVLDDVWNANYEHWNVLNRPFAEGRLGSKVLITTRNESVASIMGAVSPHYSLQKLRDDACLLLFAEHALRARDDNRENSGLGEVGELVVKKCDGLPLAVMTLRGLLASNLDETRWRRILNSNIWNLSEEESTILPALRVSYHHLPSHLKRCFAYCAIFPKDYTFDKEDLVLLWMAEGFLKQAGQEEQLEEVGNAYFNELLSRSFFQPSNGDGDDSKFVMHGLINDLAQWVARGLCFHLDEKTEDKCEIGSFINFRHSSFSPGDFDVLERFENFRNMTKLRTFLASRADRPFPSFYLTKELLNSVLPNLKCLRVLGLSHYYITEIPDLIGDLKHLRYLNLSYTIISRLPESVSTLLNLETLKLRGCSKLTELPNGIGNLINLRHLDIADTNKLLKMPSGIEKLINLRKLSKFIVGEGRGLSLRELSDLSHIGRRLLISGLHNVVDIRDAELANLKDKCGIDMLEMISSDRLSDEKREIRVFNALQPHMNLKALLISKYSGKVFPRWIGEFNLAKLESLELSKCSKIITLPSLGKLPCLKHLQIAKMNNLKTVGIEFYGDFSIPFQSFQSLKTLIFESMVAWVEWSSHFGFEGEAEAKFPRLQHLRIYNCPTLEGSLPTHLPSLQKLEIIQCPRLRSLPSRLPSVHELILEDCSHAVLQSLENLESLITLRMRSMSDWSSIEERFMKTLGALEILEIKGCHGSNSADSLAAGEQGLRSLTSLKELKVQGCPTLKSFGINVNLPSSLTSIVIKDCKDLQSLPEGIMVHGSSHDQCLLQELRIDNCPSLLRFPEGKISSTLELLEIVRCENLVGLPPGVVIQNQNENNVSSQLKHLSLSGCLRSFPESQLPSSLKSLCIRDCSYLLSLPENILLNCSSLESLEIHTSKMLGRLPEHLHSLKHLTTIKLVECWNLESLPESVTSLHNLKDLTIIRCTRLKSLPNQIHKLTCLQDLIIINSKMLEALPEGGLPLQLRFLLIINCHHKLIPLMLERDLQRLTSLTELLIEGDDYPPLTKVPQFNGGVFVFPPKLRRLTFRYIYNLEFLTNTLKLPKSVEELEISFCSNLSSLPRESLENLGKLSINNFDGLSQKLKRDYLQKSGYYWPVISRIPCVKIDKEDMI